MCALLALWVALGGCRLELAVAPGTLGPSADGVLALLEEDRVRQALDRADQLAAQYPGPQTDLLLAWALWRNGEIRPAETYFRRAANAGLAEGLIGLAGVRASAGEWEAARELAAAGLASSQRAGRAHALLAAAAWASGDRQAAADELRAWAIAEAGTSRGRAANAMAAAVDRLQGPIHTWSGESTPLRLVEIPNGSLAIATTVAGEPALLAIDLTMRQSLISQRLAEAAGIDIEGAVVPGAPGPSRRWPGILSPRQAACPIIDFGGISLRNVVVAVAAPPMGTDGVLGIDLLRGARWSIDRRQGIVVLAPPEDPARASLRRPGDPEARVVAWLGARLVQEGLAVQLVLSPRVQDNVIAAGIDLRGSSRLDSDILPVTTGSGAATTPLTLGGWSEEVVWLPGALAGWALDGGVAPSAVLGANVLAEWTLSWHPEASQIRIVAPAAAAVR